MVKKLVSFLVVAAVAVSIPTTVFAHHGGGYATYTPRATTGHCTSAQARICNTLIFDDDGNYIAEEDYEAVIDQAIKDGTIVKNDKDFYLDRYDTCIANHGACVGTYSRNVSRRGHCYR